MPRPVHFEIPADDPERAIAFYHAVFGWTFQRFEGGPPYWLINTGPEEERGINGGLLPRQHPGQACANTICVTDLDATLAAIEKNGGQIVMPKSPIPTIGWLGYCKDTEGHVFGVLQPDEKAC